MRREAAIEDAQNEANAEFMSLKNDEEAEYSVDQVIARLANAKPVPFD